MLQQRKNLKKIGLLINLFSDKGSKLKAQFYLMGNWFIRPIQTNALEITYSKRKYYMTMKKMKYIKTMEDLILHIGLLKTMYKKLELADNEPLFWYSAFRITDFTIIRLDDTREFVEVKALYRKN